MIPFLSVATSRGGLDAPIYCIAHDSSGGGGAGGGGGGGGGWGGGGG